MQKNLLMSKKSSTFAPAFRENKHAAWVPRDVNQRSVCGPKSESMAKIHMSDEFPAIAENCQRQIANRIEP